MKWFTINRDLYIIRRDKWIRRSDAGGYRRQYQVFRVDEMRFSHWIV